MGFRRNRLRSGLVIGEVALALALLSTAGLLLRSFNRLQSFDPGFDSHQVLTYRVDLPQVKYKKGAPQIDFYRRAVDRLQSIRGVAAIGVAQNYPLSGGGYVLAMTQIGKPPVPPGKEPPVEYYSVSAGYFPAMRIRLKTGRFFTDQDDASGQPVAIIDETLARKFYPGENPLGQKVQVNEKEDVIVGIVSDVRELTLDGENLPALYEAAPQNPFASMFFTVRAEADPVALIPAIRAAMRAMDPELPLDALGTMDGQVAKTISMQRFGSTLVAAFAALALILAMVGIYGVLSYAVTQATQEIGIRMALGAHAGDVLKMVLRHAMILVGAGFAIGVIAALAVGRALASQLFQMRPEDPVTYGSVALVLLITALAACAIPALRASRVDPLMALRQD